MASTKVNTLPDGGTYVLLDVISVFWSSFESREGYMFKMTALVTVLAGSIM